MSSRTITAKGGPLHGKRFTVGPNQATFPSPLPSTPGSYRVTEKQAIWEPGTKAAVKAAVKRAAEPAAKQAAPAPAPAPKPTPAKPAAAEATQAASVASKVG